MGLVPGVADLQLSAAVRCDHSQSGVGFSLKAKLDAASPIVQHYHPLLTVHVLRSVERLERLSCQILLQLNQGVNCCLFIICPRLPCDMSKPSQSLIPLESTRPLN